MKKYIALLLTTLFVAIQFVDLAIHDTPSIVADEIYAQETRSQDSPPLDSQPLTSCKAQCGCQSLHHMATIEAVASAIYAAVTVPSLPRDNASDNIAGQGPPVPPPNA